MHTLRSKRSYAVGAACAQALRLYALPKNVPHNGGNRYNRPIEGIIGWVLPLTLPKFTPYLYARVGS